MARVPHDVIAHLEVARQHMLRSAERVSKAHELHAELQVQIQASLALLEHVKGLKWLTNAPTLPSAINTSPRRNGISASNGD
jgi:hypothetical protein